MLRYVVAVACALLCCNSHAAIFTLKDVILGQYEPHTTEATPFGELTGFVEFDGPFRAMAAISDYRIDLHLLGQDKTFTIFDFKTVPPLCDPSRCDQREFAEDSKTTFLIFNPASYLRLEIPVGIGEEPKRGSIPLILTKLPQITGSFYDDDRPKGVFLSGRLNVKDDDGGKAVHAVPEPGLLAILSMGFLGTWFATRRYISSKVASNGK